MPRKYNHIFKSLVKIDNDLPGLCAYAIYKREKIKLIEDYKEIYHKDLEDDDFNDFHEKSMNDLDRYRKLGQEHCDKMIFMSIGKAVQSDPSILQKAATVDAKKTDEDKKPFMKSVLASVVGGIVLFFLPYVLVVIGLMLNPVGTKKFLKRFLPEASESIDTTVKSNPNPQTTYLWDYSQLKPLA